MVSESTKPFGQEVASQFQAEHFSASWPKHQPAEQIRMQFESGIMGKLKPVLMLRSDNPNVQVLKTYASNVEEKFAFLRTSQGMGRALGEVLMSRIPSHDRVLAFRNLMHRLREETGYLQELEGTGIAAALLGDLEAGK